MCHTIISLLIYHLYIIIIYIYIKIPKSSKIYHHSIHPTKIPHPTTAPFFTSSLSWSLGTTTAATAVIPLLPHKKSCETQRLCRKSASKGSSAHPVETLRSTSTKRGKPWGNPRKMIYKWWFQICFGMFTGGCHVYSQLI